MLPFVEPVAGGEDGPRLRLRVQRDDSQTRCQTFSAVEPVLAGVPLLARPAGRILSPDGRPQPKLSAPGTERGDLGRTDQGGACHETRRSKEPGFVPGVV